MATVISQIGGFTELSSVLRRNLSCKLRWAMRILLGVVILQAAITPHSFASSTTLGRQAHAMQTLPFTFVENRGQSSGDYAYSVQRDRLTVGFFANGADFFIPGPQRSYHRLRMRLLGGNASPVGRDRQDGRSNFLLGSDSSKWVRGAANYKEIEYPDLYHGISLLFYGNGNRLEHDFRVAADADPSRIAFRVDGAERIELSPKGDLAIHVDGGTLTLQKPVAYQYVGDKRHDVDAEFTLAADGVIRFRVGHYSTAAPLVIDPVFVFSTFLDGSGNDAIAAVTTDSTGNIYVTGTTNSVDFPVFNAEQQRLNGTRNLFATKLDPTGSKLIYSTYLGGSNPVGEDQSSAIAVDGNGNAIIAGITYSSDFPTAGAIDPPVCSSDCYFLASLSPDGSRLNYAGKIGGQAGFNGSSGVIALDNSGNVYLAGDTSSSTFLVTPGTLGSAPPGYPYSTLFVLKADPTGKLLYSTVVTGNSSNGAFVPWGIAVDAAGQAMIAGTASTGLPTTSNVVQPTFPNSSASTATAGFILQLNATASAMKFASYLPGTDSAGGLAINANGDIYVLGATSEKNLPVSVNAYETQADAGYVMELSAGAASVKASTYFSCCLAFPGYSLNAMGIALDSKSNVFIGGETQSQTFPLKNPFTSVFEFTTTNYEMAIAELDPVLTSLLFGSYLSATDTFFAGSRFSALAVDKNDDLIVTGTTLAYDFPTTEASFQPHLTATPFDALAATVPKSFISKIDLSVAAPSVCLDTYSLSFASFAYGKSVSQTVTLTNCGNAPLHLGSITSNEPSFSGSESCGTVAPGSACPITITFSPMRGGSIQGFVILTDDAAIPVQKIAVGGGGLAPSIMPVQDPVYLGHQLVGQRGSTTFYLGNSGTANLWVSSISSTRSDFSATPSCISDPYNISNCLITVTFAPQTVGTITGSLLISSNDPVNPVFVVNLSGVGDSAYQAPYLSYLDPGTAPYGYALTVNVYGSNFYPASVVRVNGAAQATTYVSNSQLQFIFPTSASPGTGQVPITVVNPSPGGSSNQLTFAPYQTLPITPSALAYVPSSGLLYAAIPAYASGNPNTVIPITPSSGAMGTPIPVGNDPRLLAASSDGQFLYVALKSDRTVQRINLMTKAVDRTFPYAICTYCSTALDAMDLQSVPGSPQQVVLAQDSLVGSTLSLYNDSGLVNTIPPNSGRSTDPTFGSLAFVGNGIFALPLTNAQCVPNTAAVGPSGLSYSLFDGYNTCLNVNQDGSTLVSDGTLLYTNAGQVWDPATMTVKAKVYVPIANSTSSSMSSHNIAMDPALNNFYIIGDATIGSTDVDALFSYSTQSLEPVAQLAFPNVTYPGIGNLVRWGSDGFAFVGPVAGGTDPTLYLIRSGLASSQSPNPVPSLSSISPAFSETGNQYDITVSVSGANFAPSSVVQWNGTPLFTNFVSATQLNADIPGALFQNAGTNLVTVATPAPGGGISGALPFTVGQMEPTASPSSFSLNFGSVPVGGASAAKYITVSNNGWAVLRFSSIAASGDFSVATNTCMSNLVYLGTESTCQIAVVFSPSAGGARTGFITISDNAPDSPQSIALTGTGNALSASVSVTPSAQTIIDTQSLSVVVAVAGSGAGAPTGSVALTAGSYSAQLQLSNGSVTFTVPAGSLTAGTNIVTAQYLGGGAYQQSIGTASVTVSQIGLTLSSASPVSPGGSTSASASLLAGSSYSGTVNLACVLSASPTGAQSLPTCTLSQASVTMSPLATTNVTLTIHTTAGTSSALIRPMGGGFWKAGTAGTVLAVVLMLGVPTHRRRRTLLLLCFTSCLVFLAGAAGCGGGGGGGSANTGPSTPGTTSGTYTFTVTGTDSSNPKITVSTMLRVTVQ